MKPLSAAPHRWYFFFGTLAVLALFGWWNWQLHAQRLDSFALHALVMPLGVFPLFILGFTFTAGPKWLAVDDQPVKFLLTGSVYFAGMVLVLLTQLAGFGQQTGLHAGLQAGGFGLMMLSWGNACWRWGTLVRVSPAKDKWHARSICGAMWGGWLALWAAGLWSLGWTAGWQLSRDLSLFCFLLPVFVTVCHRMLPFFSSNVLSPYQIWRPYPLLAGWLCGSVLMAVTDWLGWNHIMAALATVIGISFMYCSWRWGLLRSLANRMLAMLHLSFAWLCVVFYLLAGYGLGLYPWSAPIHALALGFMGTMLVGFVSRVSFGHSGRPLVVSNSLWSIYLGLHALAALRVAASIFQWPALIIPSAIGWLLLMGAWVVLMLPIYLKPRADGKAG